MLHLDQPLRLQGVEEFREVPFQALGRDIVLSEQGVADVAERRRRLDERPHPGTDPVQAVVHPAAQVENGGFAGEVARDLVARSDEHGLGREESRYPTCHSSRATNVNAMRRGPQGPRNETRYYRRCFLRPQVPSSSVRRRGLLQPRQVMTLLVLESWLRGLVSYPGK